MLRNLLRSKLRNESLHSNHLLLVLSYRTNYVVIISTPVR